MGSTKTKQFMAMLKKSLKPCGFISCEERGDCIWVHVERTDLLPMCKTCMATGAVFDSAFVSQNSGKLSNLFTLHYIFRSNELGTLLVVHASGKEFSSLSASTNAAVWDERKIQDLTGMNIVGMTDSRPLIFHPESGYPASNPVGGSVRLKPKSTVYPMQGTEMHGEFEIAVGPVHAGIIEPGHFRFHVLGEQINKMETRMFYLHRGVEKSVEGKTPSDALPLVESISGDESVANCVAFCNAVERSLAIDVPERAEFIRAILMELERIYSHLADLGGMPTDVGFFMSSSRFAALREDMMRLNQQVSGNRFLRGVCTIGGVHRDLDEGTISAISSGMDKFTTRLREIERMTLTSSTFLDRAFSTGTVSARIATDLALVGPGARASGISCDLRKTIPYSVYSRASFNEATEKNGDVLSRFTVKIAEVKESARLIGWLLSNMPEGSLRSKPKTPGKVSERIGIGWAEAPRGGCTFLVELSGDGKIKRMACRTASFRNWRALEKAVLGNIVPDFPLINKSFNLSYAGTDL